MVRLVTRILLLFIFLLPASLRAEMPHRLAYNHPGLRVDLGVGLWAWPLPMDYDQDGDHDLVVVCPDVPYSGTYFFENPSGDVPLPVFKPARRIGEAVGNPQVSYVNGRPRVLTPNMEYIDFRTRGFAEKKSLGLTANFHGGRLRANQWKYCDFDDDGQSDLLVGVGDWSDYGWDDAFDKEGNWTNGPLHGFVYLLRGLGNGRYAEPVKLEAEGEPVDVYGMPSPSLADFDGDGDQDLICGEFLDGFTYFANIGTRKQPIFAAGRRLQSQGRMIHMDLQMITPTAIDWDKDGDIDLIVGDEDGRVALVNNTGTLEDGIPLFDTPQYFQQEAKDVKYGALVTPVACDWDSDGDQDLVCGNTAGYIGFIENLDGGNPPRWAAPVHLPAGGEVIRLQAGPQGSIQGPCEAKWGYTTLSIADWDHDGLQDLVVNSIWGKVVWYRNVGSASQPRLAAAESIRVQTKGSAAKPAWNWWNPQHNELVTQWRTTPVATDWNRDGLTDLVMLDHEGYLALYERTRLGERLEVLPPQRIFFAESEHVFDSKHESRGAGSGLLRLNDGRAGRSGRRKLCLADWDGDGDHDLLVNSRSIDLLRQVPAGDRAGVWFRPEGPLTPARLAGHTTSPTLVDWDGDGKPALLIGAEDGFLYYLPR